MEIASIVLTKDYRVMEYSTNEHDEDLESFVDRGLDFTLSSISKWTDRMLEDKMDEPFYRYSIFENYLVGASHGV